MTIKTQAYLQGYLSKEAEKGTLPSEVSGDPLGILDLQGLSSDTEVPPKLRTTQVFSPRMLDALSYNNEEEAQKDRLGLKNYRALQSAAREDPQSPTVETWAQWKLKNTPPYKLKHLLSREQAEAIGYHPRLFSSSTGTKGFHNTGYPNQIFVSGNPADEEVVPAVAGHESVHVRQGHEKYRKYLEDTAQSSNTPWYGRLAAGIRDWNDQRIEKKENESSFERLRKEEYQREQGLRDLRRAGIPPSVYAGDVSAEHQEYLSIPEEAEAHSETESWARGQNMSHDLAYKGMPEWYKDILNTRGKEAATLEYRRRRALMARKILKARDDKFHKGGGSFQKYIEQSTIPNNMIYYAQDPWEVDAARADRKGILKLLEDPNSPFREKLLQAGWGNVKHGLPSAEEENR